MITAEPCCRKRCCWYVLDPPAVLAVRHDEKNARRLARELEAERVRQMEARKVAIATTKA